MEKLRLIFVTKSDPDSGNFNTARRICEGLVSLRPSWSYQIVSTTATEVDLTSANVLLCLHLHRCANLLNDPGGLSRHGNIFPPVIGIAGGTDLNEDAKLPDRRATMQDFVRRCCRIVVFSESLLQSLKQLMAAEECLAPPISIIPQGIDIAEFEWEEAQQTGCVSSDWQNQSYFIIVGRIRPVKNCHSVLSPFQQWKIMQRGRHAGAFSSKIRLLFVGDIEDSNYGEKFLAQMNEMSDVHLLRGIEHRRALKMMRQSLGLINCSLSEGQSNSVLEAMSLGVPAIVSAVPGNVDLVKHMETGLVFEDNEQLMQCLTMASSVEEPATVSLLKRITSSARKYILDRHSVTRECLAYANLIAECCGKQSDLG